MNKKELILEKYPEDEFVFADGFDEAIIGVDDESMVVVYSTRKAVSIIYNETELSVQDLEDIESSGRTVEEVKMEMALEHFYYNVKGSKGKGYPIYVDDDFEFNEV